MLELSIRLSPEDIEQDAFIEAAGIKNREEYTDEDGEFYAAFTFSPGEETTDYHAHMRVILPKEGEARIEIRFMPLGLQLKRRNRRTRRKARDGSGAS